MLPSIQEAVEKNYKELCVIAAGVSSGVYVEEPGLSYTKGCLTDWYDRVFDIRFPETRTEDVVKALIRRMNEGEVPDTALVSSGQIKGRIDALLSKSGFSLVYAQTGMAIRKSDYEPSGADFRGIRRVESGEELEPWIDCLDLAFGKKRNRTLFRRFAETEGVYLWGLYEEGMPASTAMVLLKDGVAGLHMIGTHPEHRKKGYGARITEFAMDASFARGAETVVLLSSKMGESLYASLGFKVGGTMKQMRYSPPLTSPPSPS